MKPFRKLVAAVLLLVMLFSLLSLSGCKKKDGTGTGDSHDPTGGEQLSADGEVSGGGLLDITPDMDPRILPVGIVSVPLDESIIRGAVASGSYDFTSDNPDSAMFIPIDSVPRGTIITTPVTMDGVEFDVMIYWSGEEEGEYVTCFGVSACDGLTEHSGFSQVYYLGYPSYIACEECGQVFRQDAMEVYNLQSRAHCRPWTLEHSQCATMQIPEDLLSAFEMYGWISEEETGEFSPGVNYVTPSSLIGTRAVIIQQPAIKDAYDTFMQWEEDKAAWLANNTGDNSSTTDIPVVSGTTDDGIEGIPVVTD